MSLFMILNISILTSLIVIAIYFASNYEKKIDPDFDVSYSGGLVYRLFYWFLKPRRKDLRKIPEGIEYDMVLNAIRDRLASLGFDGNQIEKYWKSETKFIEAHYDIFVRKKTKESSVTYSLYEVRYDSRFDFVKDWLFNCPFCMPSFYTVFSIYLLFPESFSVLLYISCVLVSSALNRIIFKFIDA